MLVKQGAGPCLVGWQASGAAALCWQVEAQAVATVVDSSAAGDAFAAAVLAVLITAPDWQPQLIEFAIRCGHRLAAAVLGQHGAIIARAAMPDFSDLWLAYSADAGSVVVRQEETFDVG